MVFKASSEADLVGHGAEIRKIALRFAEKFQIKVHALAVHYDHVHVCVEFANRAQYVRWSRATTGKLATIFPDLKFKFRPYTRVGKWGENFARLKNYIYNNQSETDFITHAHREHDNWLAEFIAYTPILISLLSCRIKNDPN